MPIDYSKSKIYKITSPCTNLIYIGSTTKNLKQRLCGHVTDYKMHKNGKRAYVRSFDIIKYDKFGIELIEEYSCNNKTDLLNRELHHINSNKDIVVNKNKPHGNKKEYDRLYVQQNKEKYTQYSKKYYENNKEKLKLKKTKCDCGFMIHNSAMKQHLLTTKHRTIIEALETL